MAFKMKNSALAKKADMAACPRAATKMQAESAMKKMHSPAAKMETPAKAMDAPTKAMTKSPVTKALVGKQKNLPKELRDAILAAPSKMLTETAMKMIEKSPAEMESPMKKMSDPGDDRKRKPRPSTRTPEGKKAARAIRGRKKAHLAGIAEGFSEAAMVKENMLRERPVRAKQAKPSKKTPPERSTPMGGKQTRKKSIISSVEDIQDSRDMRTPMGGSTSKDNYQTTIDKKRKKGIGYKTTYKKDKSGNVIESGITFDDGTYLKD